MDEDIGLSANALAALREFAQDQGIKIQQDDNVVSSVQQALDIKTDKQYTTFSYNYKDNFNNINIDLKGIEQEAGQTLQSTGLTIWRAAEDLAQFIFERRNGIKGKKVIELGAGLGLVGVLLGCINKEGYVNITDGDEENGQTIELLQENVKKNCHLIREQQIDVQKLWWGNEDEIKKAIESANKFKKEEEEGYDLIFGADVIYNQDAIAPLMKTVSQLLKKTKEANFYLAFARRNVPVDLVFEEAKKYGIAYQEVQNFKCKLDEEKIFALYWEKL